jgi:hypothetical protein
MKLRSYAYGAAILASVALPVIATTFAQAADCQDLSWSKDQLSKLDAVIAAEQGDVKRQGPVMQAAEVDAAIASLEQDLATRKDDGAAKGQAVLNEIRANRDAYQAKLTQLATNATADAQVTDSRPSPQEAANTFWGKVNAYLDAVNADLPTRQAATQTRFMGN